MVTLVAARREFVTNVELCLLSPILPIVASLEAGGRRSIVVLMVSALQLLCFSVALFRAWMVGQSTFAWLFVAAGAGFGVLNGAIAGGRVGPLGFGLSRVSAVQFALLLPFWHWRYLSDARIAATAAVIVLANGAFCVWFLLIVPNIERLHEAWGCYRHRTPLSGYDLGMCGLDAPWNHGLIPPVCREIAGRADGAYDCEPVHASALSLHGPHAVTTAHYMTLGALLLYTGACQRQYALDVARAESGFEPNSGPDSEAAVAFADGFSKRGAARALQLTHGLF